MKSVESMKKCQRREVVKGAFGAGVLVMFPGSALVFAQQAELEALQLNDKMFVVRGPNANVLVVDSRDGLVLVDGGEASWSPSLLALAGQLIGEKPCRMLINTHWHPEQTGSNVLLGETGTEILAHDNTRLWLSADVQQRWSGMTYKALPKAARPQSVIHDSSEKLIGEHAVQLGYMLHAHTDGDIHVHFPEAKILFAGGFLTNDTWPLIDWWTGGWTGGMLNAFDAVLPICDEQTVIVPSSGPIMTYQELKEQREMYLSIFDKIHTAFAKSMVPDEITASRPAEGYKPQWGDADLFVKLAAQSLHGHLRGGVGGWLPRIP